MADPPNRDLPDLMRSLPTDRRRKLPVPATTARHPSGEPDFTTVDARLALTLAAQRRCGICGGPMEYWIAFLGGPDAVEARAYYDPPMHEECAEASTRLCPHLARQAMRRAADRNSTGELPAGSQDEKPDQWVMWICRDFTAHLVDGAPLFLPAPHKRLRTFFYDPDRTLSEVPR